MRIRVPEFDELPMLQDIEVVAGKLFLSIGMPEIAGDEPLPIDELARFRDAAIAWVAVDGADRPMAYLLAEPVDENLHIEQISVHPDHARRGVGRSMLDQLAVRAATDGHPALTLTTFTEVAWNAPYYERCGFRPLDESALSPGLRKIRRHEAALDLDRWPRVAMRRDLTVKGEGGSYGR